MAEAALLLSSFCRVKRLVPTHSESLWGLSPWLPGEQGDALCPSLACPAEGLWGCVCLGLSPNFTSDC